VAGQHRQERLPGRHVEGVDHPKEGAERYHGAASAKAWSTASACVRTISRWRMSRSTATPATGARKKDGACAAKPAWWQEAEAG
jgi:hypothetical protein